MIHTVYLDMDEVLVDFNLGICSVLGIPYDYETFSQDYNWFHLTGKTRGEIDALCTIDFWKNLKWMHDGRKILNVIRYHFKIEQIYLLTHCMPNTDSPSGKMLWLKKHMPDYQNRTILLQFGVLKSQLAKPNTLLIDDKTEAVEGFMVAGGQGLLVPRPWNIKQDFKSLSAEVVQGELEILAD